MIGHQDATHLGTVQQKHMSNSLKESSELLSPLLQASQKGKLVSSVQELKNSLCLSVCLSVIFSKCSFNLQAVFGFRDILEHS